VLLLPGSLPTDSATLTALCETLPARVGLAKWLRACEVETVEGSWSDWERSVLPLQGRGWEGDGVQRSPKETHPHPSPPLEGEGITQGRIAIATPFHAALGLTDLTPLDPSLLQLSDADSRVLCDACDSHLREDGVRLELVTTNEWRVVTQREINVLTERPDWIIGESLRPNSPLGDDARLVERWMNELQMLLFNHPVNAARVERRLLPVNLIWLWGFDGLASAMNSAIDGRMVSALREGDVATWQRAWEELQSKILVSDVIVLGDSKPRLKLARRGQGFVVRLVAALKKMSLADELAKLQRQLSE
jgi:2,3-bisphosphoglycerate-independent phosphoglycerate mutase